MTTFKEYRAEKSAEKNKTKFFHFSGDFDGSFASNRKRTIPFFPFWDSGFAEMRNYNKVNESYMYNEKFHDHQDVKPQSLTPEHISAIGAYTSAKSNESNGHGSSKNINYYLSNRSGNKDVGIEHHTPESVLKSVKTLSAAFIPDNTNRKELETFGAVPRKIGEKLEKSNKGDVHHFPAFNSTSSGFGVAIDFAYGYHDKELHSPRVDHIIKYKLKPNTGISVVQHSVWPENEVLLHHGAHIEYSHTETIDRKSDGIKTKIHHVTVHQNHEPIENYGNYTKNENI